MVRSKLIPVSHSAYSRHLGSSLAADLLKCDLNDCGVSFNWQWAPEWRPVAITAKELVPILFLFLCGVGGDVWRTVLCCVSVTTCQLCRMHLLRYFDTHLAIEHLAGARYITANQAPRVASCSNYGQIVPIEFSVQHGYIWRALLCCFECDISVVSAGVVCLGTPWSCAYCALCGSL